MQWSSEAWEWRLVVEAGSEAWDYGAVVKRGSKEQ